MPHITQDETFALIRAMAQGIIADADRRYPEALEDIEATATRIADLAAKVAVETKLLDARSTATETLGLRSN